MTPTGTVNRRARTGTAPAGRTDKADGPERTFIIGYRPFLELCAPALPGSTCTAGTPARDSRPQRRALKEPLVPRQEGPRPCLSVTYGRGGGGAATVRRRPLGVVDRDHADRGGVVDIGQRAAWPRPCHRARAPPRQRSGPARAAAACRRRRSRRRHAPARSGCSLAERLVTMEAQSRMSRHSGSHCSGLPVTRPLTASR